MVFADSRAAGHPPLTGSAAAVASSGSASAGAVAPADGPTGPGFIVQVYGKHFHNAKDQKEKSSQYVNSTLLTNLASKEMHDLGVSYPVLIMPAQIEKEKISIPGARRSDTPGVPFGPNQVHGPFGPGPIMPGGPAANAADDENSVDVDRFTFRVQFVWQEPKSTAEQGAGTTGTVAAASAATSTMPARGAVAPAAAKP